MKTHFYRDRLVQICSGRHLTADEVYAELVADFPRAGRSTVYRNLEELASLGLVRKIQGMGPKALFERLETPHDAHFVDVRTGRVHDLPIPLASLAALLPPGFRADGADLRVWGRTPPASTGVPARPRQKKSA